MAAVAAAIQRTHDANRDLPFEDVRRGTGETESVHKERERERERERETGTRKAHGTCSRYRYDCLSRYDVTVQTWRFTVMRDAMRGAVTAVLPSRWSPQRVGENRLILICGETNTYRALARSLTLESDSVLELGCFTG